MSEDSEEPKPAENETITDAFSAISRREADSDMEEFVDEQQKMQSSHKAKGLSDAPRDISNTFKRVGIVEIGADGKEIVHVAESKTSSRLPEESTQVTDPRSAKISSESQNQPELGFEKSNRADGGILLKGIIPGSTGVEQKPSPSFDGGTLEALTPAMLKRSAANNESARLVETASKVHDKVHATDQVTEKSLSPERHQAAIRATVFLKHEIARLHGTTKLKALDVDDEDLGYALGAYLLTPDLSNKLGPNETRRFGQNMMVFGIAPAFGMADEAKEQITKNFWETINKGSGDFLIGSGFGALTELHPVVAGITGIVTGAAFLGDQLFNPINKARNFEILEILSVTGNSDIDQLLRNCDRTKDLLGQEAYNASLSAITGSVGFGPGRSLGHGIKDEIAYFDWKLATGYATEHLRKMPATILTLLATTTETTQRWRPIAVGANESPSLLAPPGSFPEKPFGLKMSMLNDEGADPVLSKSLDSVQQKNNKRLESLSGEFQSVSPEKAPECVRMLEKLSAHPDFEERIKIIGFLIREKQLHPDSPVDLDVVVRPIDFAHLKEYQTAVQNFGLMDEHNLSDLRPRDIPGLKRKMLEALERFSMATESMQNMEVAHDEIRTFNKGLDMIIDKGEIIFKPGIYEFTMEKVEAKFAKTPERRRLFEGFRQLATDLKEAGCRRIFLDGSFITGKEEPGDFDACWEPFKIVRQPKDALLLETSYEGVKARKERYLGDVFPRHTPKYGDRVETWQLDERTSKRKGIIFIDL